MADDKIGKWDGYKNYDHYYWWVNPQISEWFNEAVKVFDLVGGRTKYYNIPCAFDIETSSYYDWGKKKATMYLWSFCLNGSTILGRTWTDFIELINLLHKSFDTEKTKLIIYVHNLGYEFQFIRKWFEWDSIFAVKDRRPIHAIMKNGIEFKCSYILSNYALSYIGAKLTQRYPVQKDVGALDYSLVRHSKTPLTDTEVWYSAHDVQVVCSFIQQKIEDEGGINEIPLTNTGYVRRYCREYCFTQFQSEPKICKKLSALYHDRMQSLTIKSQYEYDQLHQAFAGGFTHAASYHSGKTIKNVGSADLASSYPAVMVMKKFPMTPGYFVGNTTVDTLEHLISKGYCVLFTVRLYGVNPRFIWENYISYSKCTDISPEAVVNNGRVASAEYLQVTITEQDWDIIKKCYTFEENKTEVFSLRFYGADYLPRPFILSILHLFANKTSLKGVEGKETEYLVSKNMINSAYGMSVTNIIRDLFDYSNTSGWLKNKADVTEQLTDYNNNHNRFLFYAWGVWVTAHARHNLWDAIFEFGEDYIYCDTDSIKGINFKKHEPFFTLYNLSIDVQIDKVCKFWHIDKALYHPKTVDGKVKTIGIWEREEDYKQFKTIGAKRYMYEYESGELLFTVSGVNKYLGTPYLLHEYCGFKDYDLLKLAYSQNPNLNKESKEAMKKVLEFHKSGKLKYKKAFDAFADGLLFPSDSTGKQTLTYVDDGGITTVKDYLGDEYTTLELSFIHMEPQSYYVSQSEEYIRFLLGIQDGSI